MMEKRDAEKRLKLKELLMEIYDMRPSEADRWSAILDYVEEHGGVDIKFALKGEPDS